MSAAAPRAIIVLRPEPGNSATCSALRAAGLTPVAYPLFTMDAEPWTAPPAAQFDALLLTSAHAARLSGAQLSRYQDLSCACVGMATAAAARDAGLNPVHIGDALSAQAMLDATTTPTRWLWLCGAEHQPLVAPPHSELTPVVTYRANPVPTTLSSPENARPEHARPEHAPPEHAPIVLVHSAAAARALAALPWDRAALCIIAGSAVIAAALGEGWQRIDCAASPLDRDMVALTRKLWQTYSTNGVSQSYG